MTEVEAVLTQLVQREDGPFVMRLPREPGKRESRYAHLFSGDASGADEHAAAAGFADTAEQGQEASCRLSLLEERVTELEAEVTVLKKLVSDLASS